MSREADGVYYNPMKDPERDARAARYAAEQDEQYYRTNQTQQQQEYYVEEEPATPLEQAYWSTMPSSYKGDGQVKIVNNYYDSRYVEKNPSAPKISISLGYGWGGGWYGPSWGFGISWGNSWYDPWYYDPWYYPSWNWGVERLVRPLVLQPMVRSVLWLGTSSGTEALGAPADGMIHGTITTIAPEAAYRRLDRPPRRYSTGTQVSQYPRPSTRPSTGGGSDVRNPSRPTQPPTGTSTQGYNRRPTTGSGTSTYRPSGTNGSSSSTAPSTRPSGTSGQRSEYRDIRNSSGSGGSSSSPRRYYSPRSSSSSSSSTRSYTPSQSSSTRSSSGNTSSTRSYTPSSSSSSSSRSSSGSGGSSSSSSGSASSGGSVRR